jgi:hypothetical protein
VKVHSKAIGTDPETGNRYDANDPMSQLWIHLTAWHSILYAYEKYGPGKLSAEEEAQYWRECAIGAELQTCDPATVPKDRAGVQAYFDWMRPQLIGSDVARSTMDHLLHAEVMLPPVPTVLKPLALIVGRALRIATIATMPHWMREMSGLKQSRVLDAAITPVMKVAFRLAALNKNVELMLLRFISPSTVPVVAPIFRNVAPTRAETLTPEQARERYGYPKPADAHLEWRAKQAAKVFDEHVKPSDDGLVESEPILGSMV